MVLVACASQVNPHVGRDGALLMLLYVCKLLTHSNAALRNLLVHVLFVFSLHFLGYSHGHSAPADVL